MKSRKSKTYLVLSSCHLGMSVDILELFGQVAKYFGAQSYHLGPVITEHEQKELNKTRNQISKLEDALYSIPDEDSDTNYDKTIRLESQIDALTRYSQELSESIKNRLTTLSEYFPNITLVGPSKSDLPVKIGGIKLVDEELVMSKYLLLSGLQPASERVTIRPSNRNSIQYLKQYGQQLSWIVPHPVPTVFSFPRPGLNNSHSYITVGSLHHAEKPKTKRDIYKASFSPAAVLVTVDEATGFFWATHLHVDYIEKKSYDKAKPVILYDGLCFTTSGVSEVKSKDRAVFETDDHEPYVNAGVLGAVSSLNSIFKPGTFINGGDASDCSPVCRHEVHSRGKRENKRILDMFVGLRKLLDVQADCDSIKEKILLESNHHEWLTIYVDDHPELKGLVDWPTIQQKMFSDWTFLDAKEGYIPPYSFGDYTVRHGHQDSFNTAELIFKFGKYLCGHRHRYMAIRRAVGVGCGANLAPEYTDNQINAWQHQITTLTRFEGVTAVAPKIILHDEKRQVAFYVYRNKICEAPFRFLGTPT